MKWRETLRNMFGGYVAQDTLEEGVEGMVGVSSVYEEYHNAFMEAFNRGIDAAKSRDNSIIELVSMGGYKVLDVDMALDLLTEFKEMYLREYLLSKAKS